MKKAPTRRIAARLDKTAIENLEVLRRKLGTTRRKASISEALRRALAISRVAG